MYVTDFTVLTGEWVFGRIYEVRGSPPDLLCFWALHLNGPIKRSDRVASLEEAKDQFKIMGSMEGLGKPRGTGLGGTLMSSAKLCGCVLAHGTRGANSAAIDRLERI